MLDAGKYRSLGTNALLAAVLCFWLAAIALFGVGATVTFQPEDIMSEIFEPDPRPSRTLVP